VRNDDSFTSHLKSWKWIHSPLSVVKIQMWKWASADCGYSICNINVPITNSNDYRALDSSCEGGQTRTPKLICKNETRTNTMCHLFVECCCIIISWDALPTNYPWPNWGSSSQLLHISSNAQSSRQGWSER
jgi:hypothetical protein